MNKTENRKDEHVRISIEKNVSAEHNYWDDIVLIHDALPEINKDEINLSTNLFGKKLGAPIIIASMTGGYNKAKKINENLAIAAEKYQVGMGVGSQRAALEKTVDMIDADAFIVCLNFLQEAVMPEGEANAKGVLDAIEKLADDLDKPVIVKESGAGMSYDVAGRLSEIGIAGFDVGGLGGTSFSAIEHYRADIANDKLHKRGGKTFWNWGIPTPTSILEVGDATNWILPIIATGGIRNGLDAAKALVLGADCAGIARALLGPATKSKDATLFELEAIVKELRATMFLTGINNVQNIEDVDWTVIGEKLWI